MAQYTSNYNLSKPESTDTNASFISAYRDNMDIIDKQMGNKNIAEEYDNTQTYAVDEYVIYEGGLYKCTTAVTSAEDFDPTKWTQTVASDEFGSGGGGGSSTLAGLSDVNLTTPSNGQVLKYNSTSQKWENANESGGGGGGGGSFERETIYSANAQASNYVLNSPLTNFDAIEVLIKAGTGANAEKYILSAVFTIDELMDAVGTDKRFGITGDAWYIYFTVTDASNLVRSDTNGTNLGVTYIYEIVGLKFGGGGSGGSAEHEYSTTEQVVGKWIDGKPIYEKTWTGLDVTATTAWLRLTDVSIPNVSNVINCKLFRESTDTAGVLVAMQIGEYSVNDPTFTCLQVKVDDNSAGKKIKIAVVQYTKTTD